MPLTIIVGGTVVQEDRPWPGDALALAGMIDCAGSWHCVDDEAADDAVVVKQKKRSTLVALAV